MTRPQVPDFSSIDLGPGTPGGGPVPSGEPWLTPEQITHNVAFLVDPESPVTKD